MSEKEKMKKTTSFRIEATKNDERSSFFNFVFNTYNKYIIYNKYIEKLLFLNNFFNPNILIVEKNDPEAFKFLF